MNRIVWQPKAFRQLKKVADEKTRRDIYAAVDALTRWPDCQGVKALQDRPGYRLRVGDWRVIFAVHQAVRVVEIQEVRRRNERTY